MTISDNTKKLSKSLLYFQFAVEVYPKVPQHSMPKIRLWEISVAVLVGFFLLFILIILLKKVRMYEKPISTSHHAFLYLIVVSKLTSLSLHTFTGLILWHLR